MIPEELPVVIRQAGLLEIQISRGFNHNTMQKVCRIYVQAEHGQFSEVYARLISHRPPPVMFEIAKAFIALQEARHSADYDISSTLSDLEAVRLVRLAVNIFTDWAVMEHSHHGLTFLSALLLHDLWRGRS